MNKNRFACASDFKSSEIYYPDKRPGYTAWASIFQFGNGDIGVSFCEIIQGKNPDFFPADLEFIEGMNLPYRFGPVVLPAVNENMISEYVYMKSSDGGINWRVTGRSRVRTRHYWHEGYEDGHIIRMSFGAYCCELGKNRFRAIVEESKDGGNTWSEISSFLPGYFFYNQRLKKLRDNSLVACGAVMQSFGPGGEVDKRGTIFLDQIKNVQGCFFVSFDKGHTWNGPHYVLPGTGAHEFDFVELNDGGLLFIHSDVQSGIPARQVVHRTDTGFVNGPLMEIHRGSPPPDNVQGGFIPETIVITDNGLIVGARRSNVYSCSKDLGENWYEIEGIPTCNYQPMITNMPDGRFTAIWHYGGDNAFGEVDMNIGIHSFRLEEHLPTPASLIIKRELSVDGSQYINAFCSKLMADGKPQSGRSIEFRVKPVWLPDGRENSINMDAVEDIRKTVTDDKGMAHIVLEDKDVIPDIHYSYIIDAVFRPVEDDILQECHSQKIFAYAMTPRRNCPANYAVYITSGLIMVTQRIMEIFPELTDVINKLDKGKSFTTLEDWEAAVRSRTRAEEIIEFLVKNHVLVLKDHGKYEWYQSVHHGNELIKGIRVCTIEENYI